MQLLTLTPNTSITTKIVGILNLTPDSFYDGGRFCNIDTALKQVEQMIQDGADIIDIGGESTRPGHTQISADEEINRIKPIIKAIRKKYHDFPLSIDTYKAPVAKVALELRVNMVNDIWGLKYDNDMAGVIAETGVACVLGHNTNIPLPEENFISHVKSDLKESVDIALKAGIKKENIILDPGIGFGGKSLNQNLTCIREIPSLKELGYPIYIGTSNKSFIGLILNAEKQDRLYGTIASNLIAILNGAEYIRVHDVKAHKDALDMLSKFTN